MGSSGAHSMRDMLQFELVAHLIADAAAAAHLRTSGVRSGGLGVCLCRPPFTQPCSLLCRSPAHACVLRYFARTMETSVLCTPSQSTLPRQWRGELGGALAAAALGCPSRRRSKSWQCAQRLRKW